MMRKLADEAHGVRDQHITQLLGVQHSRGGVQGVKQPVVGVDPRPGECVEHGGLSRIGIAHDTHQGHLGFFPLAALGGPDAPEVVDLLFQLLYFAADVAAVGLQLGLAGASGADGAAAAGGRLAHQMGPHTGEAGQQVLVLGQLHLQLALGSVGPVGKNVQDQGVAVDDPAGKVLLQRPPLRGRQLVVKDHQVYVVGLDQFL